MTRQSVEPAVLKVLASILKQDFRSPDGVDRASTPGWDSLKHVEIVFAIEEEFGIQLDDEELKSATSATRLIEIVESKR